MQTAPEKLGATVADQGIQLEITQAEANRLEAAGLIQRHPHPDAGPLYTPAPGKTMDAAVFGLELTGPGPDCDPED